MRCRIALLLCLAAGLTAAAAARAETERDSAETRRDAVGQKIETTAEARIAAQKQAEKLSAEVARLRAELKRAGEAMLERRREVAAAAQAAEAAEAAAQAASDAIARRRRELASLLGAMARLTLRPSEALAALKDGPAEAAKASLALKALLPEIDRRIGQARTALREAADLQAEQLARREAAADAVAAMKAERQALDRTVAAKRRLVAAAQATDKTLAREVSQLAGEAKTLDAFINALAARESAIAAARAAKAARDAAALRERRRQELAALEDYARRARPQAPSQPLPPSARTTPQPGSSAAVAIRPPAAPAPPESRPGSRPDEAPPAASPPRDAAAAPSGPPIRLAGIGAGGAAAQPVAGALFAQFGQGEGVYSRGWVYVASAAAEVFAPSDGRVAYAGPFKGYGNVVLIANGESYHTLLTGLGTLDVTAGDWVLQGEPVGALPKSSSGGASGGDRPKLYVEVRKNGEPVDPASWFVRPT